jgi:hypothetical protein
MEKQTQTHLALAPQFDLEAEVGLIMQLPCAEAMARIWRLHRMLKSPANELPPPKLIDPPLGGLLWTTSRPVATKPD